ncbi:MAG: polysaccharide deacetylase family protein [Candidatus Zixiibacteriota bacterium]|nr:MAG: polysaccharide deacetylase family protein [candidate division Zixibacteria bacterium]
MESSANILTVDLEEWFVVEALSGLISREDWSKLPSTVVRNTRRLLELFRIREVSSTWFVLGWVAEQHPDLIREIQQEGHEIACHSYAHIRVNKLEPDSFRRDTKLAIEAITKAIGYSPIGYRAPSWSIDPTTPWAFKVISELGFEYDSSIFPIKHDIYGVPDGPRYTFKMNLENGRVLYEIPASTYRLFGKNIPFGGGGFLRHSPYWYSRRMIRHLNKHNQPVLVYIHPWEIDSNPPQIEGLSAMQRFRTYGSTSVFISKLDRLLKDFQFYSMGEYIKEFKKRRIGFHVE